MAITGIGRFVGRCRSESTKLIGDNGIHSVAEPQTKPQDLRRRGGEETEGWRKKNNFNTEEPEKKNLRMQEAYGKFAQKTKKLR